jgi:hypothetical protein
MERFETLTAAYFDERLSGSDSAGLARVLETDPAKATQFVEEYEIDRLLRLRDVTADESRIDAILDQIRGESDPFVRSVFQAVKQGISARTEPRAVWRNRVKELFSRPVWALFAAACLLVIGCAWIFYFGIPVGEPRLELAASASIEIVRGAISTSARQGFDLRAGDLLKVTGTSEATLSFAPEKTRIHLHPGTELKLVNYSGAKRFVLNTGKIEASVARQRILKPMLIRTPQAEARVIGTRFTLSVDTNATVLDVAEGKVKFTRLSDGRSAKVTAGNSIWDAELVLLPETGRILREYWTNLVGNSMTPAGSTLRSKQVRSQRPDGFDYLPSFESRPLAPGLHFRERIRGYVQPPKTGLYRFALTTVHVETVLLLSRTDRPENAVQVAFQTPDSKVGPSLQQVTPVPLQAGRQYYIEAVHESDGGDGHLTVSWQMPGGEPEIIPGKFLSPFPTQEEKGKE